MELVIHFIYCSVQNDIFLKKCEQVSTQNYAHFKKSFQFGKVHNKREIVMDFLKRNLRNLRHIIQCPDLDSNFKILNITMFFVELQCGLCKFHLAK